MKPPKFKIGDKVKVMRASTHAEEHLWDDVWFAEGMDCMIGEKYTIRAINDIWCGNEFISYLVGGYMLPEFVLQDATIGKQLLFDFMGQ